MSAPLFNSVKMTKHEVTINGTKYLHRAGVLYTIRDRESDPDFTAEEDWTFKAWCGPKADHAEHLRLFQESVGPQVDGDCLICMEPYNKGAHAPIQCPYCSTSFCRTCVQTCLLQDNVPKCQEPSCRKVWTGEFLRSQMTKTFLLGPYKSHREKILLDQEKARLPETQEDAQRYINAKALLEPIETRLAEIEAARVALPAVAAFKSYNFTGNLQVWRIIKSAAMIAEGDYMKTVREEIKELKSEAYTIAVGYRGRFGTETQQTQREQRDVTKKAWTFTMRCPDSGCEGFVGLGWSCGLCSKDVCKDCQEFKGSEHVCDADKVATVKAIKKEAKPCPKCAALISKIDGCDQMWCTQCHTAYSWRTGEVETRIHNPHYFQWMRNTGQAIAPVPQAAQLGAAAGCGAVQHMNMLDRAYIAAGRAPHRVYNTVGTFEYQMLNWVRVLRHVHYNEYLEYQRRLDDYNEEKKHNLRVQRLAKENDDKGWSVQLQRMEKAQQKRTCLQQIYEMYMNVAIDLLRPYTENPASKDDQLFVHLASLTAYTNDQLARAGKEFNSTIHLIETLSHTQ